MQALMLRSFGGPERFELTTLPDPRPAASEVLVRNLLNGGPLLTKIDVHTGGLIYSLAYQF